MYETQRQCRERDASEPGCERPVKSPPRSLSCRLRGPIRGIGATFFTPPSTWVHAAFAGCVRLSSLGHTAVLSKKHTLHITRNSCSESSPTP